MGSLQSELLQVDRGLYVVKAVVIIAGDILASGLAAQATLEAAEDLARERALLVMGLMENSPAPTTASVTPPPVKSAPVAPILEPETTTPRPSQVDSSPTPGPT